MLELVGIVAPFMVIMLGFLAGRSAFRLDSAKV